MDYWWVWSRQSISTKLRTTKFSSEGLGGISTKFSTSENFPLYGMTLLHIYLWKTRCGCCLVHTGFFEVRGHL